MGYGGTRKDAGDGDRCPGVAGFQSQGMRFKLSYAYFDLVDVLSIIGAHFPSASCISIMNV